MSKAFLGAFVAIAIVAVTGVDYLNQARQAGSAPGDLTAAGYAASIADRLAGRDPQRAAVVAATASAPAPAKGSAKGSGKGSRGILAMITGLFGGGQSTATATASAAVTRIGANGDCALSGRVKRCSVGRN